MNNTIALIFPQNRFPGAVFARYAIATVMVIAASGIATATIAYAQDSSYPDMNGIDGDFAKKNGWDVSVGGGLTVTPTYEGSDKSRTIPVPFAHAVYDDMFSLGVDGLNTYWHQDNFRIGAGLTFNPGRKDHETNGLIQSGDDRLRGMGDIAAAPGLKLFGSYNLGRLNFGSTVTKFEGSDNKGLIVDLGANLPFRLTDKLTLTSHVGATWANREYMQTFFGVTSIQSVASGFSEFAPKASLKDVEAGFRADYRLDQHWFISTNIGVKRLEGDAAKSPINFANMEGILTAVLGYHF